MAGEPILIVDDTPVNLKITRAILAGQGYQVFTASTAEEALGLIESYRPRLVLTDLHLPGISGLELARGIKSGELARDTIIVALSAFAGPDEVDEALQAGCDGYISKPIDTRSFPEQVRNFLDHRTATAAAASGPAPEGLTESALLPLRGRFLEESAAEALQWTSELEGQFQADAAAQMVHQWIGAAGLLGYPEVSDLARELEVTLRMRPLDAGELREALDEMLWALAARMAEQKPEG